MSAASPPPTGPAPVPPVGSPPPVDHPPGHPHHGKTPAELAALEVQDNALYRGVKSFWARAKAGDLLPSKVLAVIVLVVVAGGLWWWFSGQSTKTESRRWAGLHNLTASDDLNKFAADNPNSTANLVARRSRARNLLAAEGTERLKSKGQAERLKGVENIETARTEMLALAELFKDRTLKAACLLDAAVAERALIGVPKPGAIMATENAADSRGSAAKAADFYRQAAKAIGANTPAGEKYEKDAKELEAAAATTLATNSFLYSTVAAGDVLNPEPPKPDPTPTPGTGPTPGPKTPGTNPSPKTPATSSK